MNQTENIEDLPPAQRLLEAGKRYIAAEQVFEQAKRDLNNACDAYCGEGEEELFLPHYVWDNTTLYQVIYVGAKPLRFRQIPFHDVVIAPAVG